MVASYIVNYVSSISFFYIHLSCSINHNFKHTPSYLGSYQGVCSVSIVCCNEFSLPFKLYLDTQSSCIDANISSSLSFLLFVDKIFPNPLVLPLPQHTNLRLQWFLLMFTRGNIDVARLQPNDGFEYCCKKLSSLLPVLVVLVVANELVVE